MAVHVVLPWIHTVFANLKTWAKDVFHGLREPHLRTYLDEFVFRFNRRRRQTRALQDVDRTGSKCINSYEVTRVIWSELS
jgi:hypothetical protein